MPKFSSFSKSQSFSKSHGQAAETSLKTVLAGVLKDAVTSESVPENHCIHKLLTWKKNTKQTLAL